MWADREGYVDTTGTVWAYAGAAKKRGATVIEHNRVARTEPAARPDLGRRHRERNDQRRARRQRRRPLGETGRADGRARSAGLPARTPLPHHRDDPRSRGAEGGNADGRRPRRLHLHAPGPEGDAGRDLRDPSSTLVDGRRALGLRRRAASGEHRPHLGGTRTRPSTGIRFCRRPASANGSTAHSPSLPTAIRWSARSRASRATGSPAA